MAQAREGLYAYLFLAAGTTSITTTDVVMMLTGVDISWTAAKKRFYSSGSLLPESVLDGIVAYEGSFKRAYYSNRFATMNTLGTWRLLGSLSGRGTASPAIFGTIVLNGGNLSNMAAESSDPVTEEHSFIMYNVTTLG